MVDSYNVKYLIIIVKIMYQYKYCNINLKLFYPS